MLWHGQVAAATQGVGRLPLEDVAAWTATLPVWTQRLTSWQLVMMRLPHRRPQTPSCCPKANQGVPRLQPGVTARHSRRQRAALQPQPSGVGIVLGRHGPVVRGGAHTAQRGQVRVPEEAELGGRDEGWPACPSYSNTTSVRVTYIGRAAARPALATVCRQQRLAAEREVERVGAATAASGNG